MKQNNSSLHMYWMCMHTRKKTNIKLNNVIWLSGSGFSFCGREWCIQPTLHILSFPPRKMFFSPCLFCVGVCVTLIFCSKSKIQFLLHLHRFERTFCLLWVARTSDVCLSLMPDYNSMIHFVSYVTLWLTSLILKHILSSLSSVLCQLTATRLVIKQCKHLF